MNLTKIVETINLLSTFITITEEDKIIMLETYKNYNTNEIVLDLGKKIFRMVGPKSPYYDYALSTLKNLDYFSTPSVDDMKYMLEQEFSTKKENNEVIEKTK